MLFDRLTDNFGGWPAPAPAAPAAAGGCDALAPRKELINDANMDGFGAADAIATIACSPPAGAVSNSLDCDDGAIGVA
jgi:hypothetical protein